MNDKDGPKGLHKGASASNDILLSEDEKADHPLNVQSTKVNPGKPPPGPSSLIHQHDESDPNTNSFISFNSHLSTQFDNILLAHATNLRSEIDNIKMNLCNHLKVQDNEFAKITALNIKNCMLLNKLTLGSSLLSLLDSSEKVCATITQCAESAVFWKQSSFILKKTYLMLKISFYIVKLAQKSIKTHLKILGGKNFS